MGKNSAVKSLARVIGNIAWHKYLLEHTNKPESKSHLNYEIVEYSADAFEKSQEFNWNEDDKIEIREKALERAKNLSQNYSDVSFNKIEVEKLIDEVAREVGL